MFQIVHVFVVSLFSSIKNQWPSYIQDVRLKCMSVLFIYFMHVAGIRDTLSAYQSLKQRLAFHLRAITGKKVKLNVINYSPSHARDSCFLMVHE